MSVFPSSSGARHHMAWLFSLMILDIVADLPAKHNSRHYPGYYDIRQQVIGKLRNGINRLV